MSRDFSILKCLRSISRDAVLLSIMCQACCLQDQAMHVRRALLRKIHHYLKDRSLSLKYATAYALCAVDTEKEIAQEVNILLFFIMASVVVVVLSIPFFFRGFRLSLSRGKIVLSVQFIQESNPHPCIVTLNV